jgi:hypothetical protein
LEALRFMGLYSTKDSLRTANAMVMEYILIQMGMYIGGNSKKIASTAMATLDMKMAMSTMANGKMTKDVVLAY